ncbi:MAG: class IV adenylate cyclase [Patescibacteria group bacterium]
MIQNETEVKFRVSDFAPVVRELKRVGGRLDWKGTERTVYFDTPSGTLRKLGSTLRLREWNRHSVSLTYKGKQKGGKRFKVREELQVELDDLATAKRMLLRLGFAAGLRYAKHREHWILRRTVIELDTIAGRRFVEVEGTKSAIERMARRLGLD